MTGSSKITHLNQPWSMGDLKLKNRVVMASLTRNRNLVPDQVNADYYSQRASAGLIITEAVMIEPQGSGWINAPGIWSKKQIAGWKKVTNAVHKKGGAIFAQLWHSGRIGHPWHNAGMLPPAPSAIAASGGNFRLLEGAPGHPVPEEIEDPKHYIELFKQAATNAKEAGFDGVELHGANGFLVHQFLDSGANQRTDRYGGSIENRSRFALEAIDSLLEVYSPNRVGIKLTPSGGYNDVGEKSVEATKELYSHLIAELDKRNIGYIQLSRYLSAFVQENRGMPFDLTTFVPLIKNSAIIFNGGFSAEEADQYILENKATAVAFGRIFIPNPDATFRLLNDLELEQLTDFKAAYTYPDNQKHVGYSDFKFHNDNPEKA